MTEQTQEPEPAWAARRSWLIHNVRERADLVFHIGRGDAGMAACSRWFLDDTFVMSPAEVPRSLRCQRPACRKHWPD